jgi:hypothetical protein
MTVPDIYKDLLQVFGVSAVSDATPAQQDRIVNDLNATIQQMAAAGSDFYGREEITVPLTGGEGFYDLDADIQSVLEPATLEDGTPLTRLTSRGQVVKFGPVFLGQASFPVTDGRPIAYYVFPLRADADAEDSVAIKVQLLPAPSVSEAGNSLKLDVIRESAPVSVADLTDDSSKLPVPHKYVESILLPIARWNLTSSYLFFDKEKQPRFDEDYGRALKLLGVSDPRTKSGMDETRDERETLALPAPAPK